MLERGTRPPPFFWKCVKRKGFKSFVLKVCDSKGVTDAFLRKCVNLKELEQKSRELTVESRKRAVEGGGAMAFGEGMGGLGEASVFSSQCSVAALSVRRPFSRQYSTIIHEVSQ